MLSSAYCMNMNLELSHQRKAHILRVFVNKVTRRVFEYTREETSRGWKKIAQ